MPSSFFQSPRLMETTSALSGPLSNIAVLAVRTAASILACTSPEGGPPPQPVKSRSKRETTARERQGEAMEILREGSRGGGGNRGPGVRGGPAAPPQTTGVSGSPVRSVPTATPQKQGRAAAAGGPPRRPPARNCLAA